MKTALTAAAATALFAGAAAAEPVDWTLTGGIGSDYVKRGVSRLDDGPQVFGGVDADAGLFYAGVWASNADLGGADAEADLYVGARPELAGFQLDLSAARNVFLGEPDGGDLDYWDLQAEASREIGPVRGAVLLGWSPDYLGAADEAWWAQAGASVELGRRWTLSAAAGREESDLSEHVYWNIGTAVALTDRITADVRWWDTDAGDLGEAYEGRLVASIKAAF